MSLDITTTKLSSKLNKLSHGTSRLIVRDSYRYAASIMIGFIALTVSLCLVSDTYATSSSITVTMDDNIVDLNVAPTANGTFSKSSANKIGVATTNYTGYTLSISASGNNDSGNSSDNGGGSGSNSSNNPTALINGDKSLSSIETAITEEQFKALDNTAYNNMWGYLPSKYNSTSNTSFLPSPSTSGDILDITSTANAVDSSTGNPIVNEYEITLGARVDTTASLGSYSNVFLVDVVANAVSYSFIYNDNVVSNVPTDLNSTTMNSNESISSNIPIRDGYTFLGWCLGALDTTNITTADGIDTCASTIYQPGASITIDQTGGDNDKYFYAMWSKDKSIEDLSYMQDFANLSSAEKINVLNSMTVNTSYMLVDRRDGHGYTVVKMSDGSVWMNKDLNLGSSSNMILTSSDTNILASTYTLPASPSAPNFPTSDDLQYIYTNGVTGYYTYAAATAGTNPSDGDAVADICPAGWKIPSTEEAASLFGLYPSFATLTRKPFFAELSGAYAGENLVLSITAPWLSKPRSANVAHMFCIRQSAPSPDCWYYKREGHTIRCTLK